jgi:hypothetical protein
MAISILRPLYNIINKTTGEIVDSQLNAKIAGILNTFISASFDAADSALSTVRDLTKPDAPSASPADSSKASAPSA